MKLKDKVLMEIEDYLSKKEKRTCPCLAPPLQNESLIICDWIASVTIAQAHPDLRF